MKPMTLPTKNPAQHVIGFSSVPSPGRIRIPAQNRWLHAVIGSILGIVCALIFFLPAHSLTERIAKTSAGQVQWLNTRGTVWHGSAQLVLSGGSGSRNPQALPGRLHWTLSPTWEGMRFSWQADCCMTEAASMLIKAGWNTLTLQIDNHTSSWPAGMLTGLGAPWNTLQADGQLHLRTQALQLDWSQSRLQMQGLAELTVKDLSSRLSPVKPMGSYRINLTGTPKGTHTPSLMLNTLEGPLMLNGQGLWIGQRLRFTGEAHATEGHEAAFDNLLNILGRRQGTRSLLSLG